MSGSSTSIIACTITRYGVRPRLATIGLAMISRAIRSAGSLNSRSESSQSRIVCSPLRSTSAMNISFLPLKCR